MIQRKNIQSLHTYNKLRKEKLNVDELRQYDLSVDLVSGVKQDIPYDRAFDIMIESLAPLGEEYIETLKSFKDKRYIDVRETPGKRSGAYNFGVYGVHPFILLNHHDDLNSLFTLTHECKTVCIRTTHTDTNQEFLHTILFSSQKSLLQ